LDAKELTAQDLAEAQKEATELYNKINNNN